MRLHVEYLLSLPAELRNLLIDLDKAILQQINIDLYSIDKLKYVKLAELIANEIDKIDFSQYSELIQNKIKTAKYFFFEIADNYEYIYKLTENQNNFIDFIWYFISSEQLIKRGMDPDTRNIKKLDNGPENPNDIFIYNTILNYEQLDYKSFIHQFDEIIENNSIYIITNYSHILSFIDCIASNLVIYGFGEIEFFDTILSFTESSNYNFLMMEFYNNIGNSKNSNFKIEAAIEYYQKCIDLSILLGHDRHKSIKMNLGNTYEQLGDLKKAESFYIEAKANGFEVPVLYNNLIALSIVNEDYNKGYEYYLEKISKFGSQKNMIDLYTDFTILLSNDKLEETEILFNEFKGMNEKINFYPVLYSYFQAEWEHYHGNIGAAISYVEKYISLLMKFNVLFHVFRALALKIQYQIDQYEISKNKENTRNSLFNTINSYIELADEQGVSSSSVKGLIIRSKLLAKFDQFQDAEADLGNAMKLSEEFNLNFLVPEIELEMKLLNTMSHKSLSDSSFFKLIKSQINKLLSFGGGTKFKKQDYVIHGIIIITNGGVPIFTELYTDKLKSEPVLISGLITAVSSFIAEIIEGRGYLKSIMHDDLTIMLEPMDKFMIADIISRETFEARQKLHQFRQEVEKFVKNNKLEDFRITKEIELNLNQISHQIFAS